MAGFYKRFSQCHQGHEHPRLSPAHVRIFVREQPPLLEIEITVTIAHVVPCPFEHLLSNRQVTVPEVCEFN